MVNFLLRCEVIISDHDGYCSGEENEDVKMEKIYNRACMVSRSAWITLKFLKRADSLNLLFDHGFEFRQLQPLDTSFKSGYCKKSPLGRKHKKEIISLEILDVIETPMRNKSIKLKYLKLPHDEILKRIFNAETAPMVTAIHVLNIPSDVIGIIMQFYLMLKATSISC